MADIDDVVRLVMRETWYWSAKHQVGEALQNQLKVGGSSDGGGVGDGASGSVLKQVQALMKESGLDTELASMVYTLLRKPKPTAPEMPLLGDQMPSWHPPPPTRDGGGPLESVEAYSFIRTSTASWWSKIFKRVNQISKQFKVP
eukprot:gene10482-8264_t